MNARDQLAEVIRGIDGPATLGGLEVADAILASGYRKRRVITTTQELDDAIRKSFHEGENLVLMTGTRPWTIWESEDGLVHVSSAPYEDDPEHLTLDDIHLPALVLWEPTQ